MRASRTFPAVLTVLALVLAACGAGSKPKATQAAPNPNAKEKSPPGDIPDSTQFVRFTVPGAGYSVEVPEGWARTGSGSSFTFTSNLNSVSVASGKAAGSSSRAAVVAGLQKTAKGFRLQSAGPIKRSGQTALRVRYLASSTPDPVTGKRITDAAERYVFTHGSRAAIVTVAGPKGADNVDAWRTISNSVRWSR